MDDKRKIEFEKTILQRFSVEGASNYINIVIDRQITKALGLLTINAVLFAAFTNINANNSSILLTIASLLVLLSSFPLMWIMYVEWGEAEQYSDGEKDFRSGCKTAYERKDWLFLSIILSAFALFIAIYLKTGKLFNLLECCIAFIKPEYCQNIMTTV